jgi:signal transduction histidine kinase
VALKISIAPRSALILADRDLISRVLQNLLDNGLKFTRPDSAILISTQWSTSGEKIELSVADQGHGVPEYLRDRLFEKFHTGEHEMSGSGLGLAFCKMALEAQKEKIWISETSENGTTFTCTLAPFKPS